MNRNIRALTFIAGVLFAGIAFGADKYAIDIDHTSIGFSIKHLMISTVKGKFNEVSGTILYDEKDITKSSVSISIKTESIDTDNKKRDDHLRSADFFDAAKYPEITFKSNKIQKKGKGWVAVGTFTMHGVSKEVSIPFKITGKAKDPWGMMRLGVDAGLTINRQDYGVAYNKVLEGGGVMVGNDVKIELNVEAIKK